MIRPRHKWTDQEIEKLKNEFPHKRTQLIADEFGLAYHQVTQKAHGLKLAKSQEFMNSPESGRLDGVKGMETRYKKGHVSHNKGKKLTPEEKEKFKHTWFEKGHTPHNTKYDGYERISAEGYREIRISEGNFVHLHRKNWEDRFGPIPDGYVVAFKNGDRLNCNPENLELITHKENMIRNSIHNYPEELRTVIRLQFKLKRHIKNGK